MFNKHNKEILRNFKEFKSTLDFPDAMLHSYNITHEHLFFEMNRERHSNILNDLPYKISRKMDNLWMYYSQSYLAVMYSHPMLH